MTFELTPITITFLIDILLLVMIGATQRYVPTGEMNFLGRPKRMRVSGPWQITLLFALGCFALAFLVAQQAYVLDKEGIRTTGSVVDYGYRVSRRGGRMRCPIIRFVDGAGQEITKENPKCWGDDARPVGTMVTVVYLKDDPVHSAAIEQDWTAYIPAGTGAFVGFMALYAAFRARLQPMARV